MITPPDYDDGRIFYMFVPMRATLYGREYPPYHFLRVVEGNSGRSSTRMKDDNGDVYLIETVGLATFIEFLSYGYSPYIECALSGMRNGLNMQEDSEALLTQALMRNYESRCSSLIGLCERKSMSISGMLSSNQLTGELIDEVDGALSMWDMLMNTGKISPVDCLQNIPWRKNSVLMPLKRMKNEFMILDERLGLGNHRDLKFKLTEFEREKLLKRYRVMN